MSAGTSGTGIVRPSRLVLLPGMGATGAMHRAATTGVPGITNCDWPDDVAFDSLAGLAVHCIHRCGISAADAVGGSSMGGMVAIEIARRLRSPLVVLIGSARCGGAVPALRLAKLARPLATAETAGLIGMKGRVSALCAMYARVRPAFIRRSLDAVSRWTGTASPPCAVRSIHGRLDPIIRWGAEPHDATVATGGHFIALSHPRRVAAFLRGVLTDPALA